MQVNVLKIGRFPSGACLFLLIRPGLFGLTSQTGTKILIPDIRLNPGDEETLKRS